MRNMLNALSDSPILKSSNIILCYDNYIVVYEDGWLYLSDNYGKSYVKKLYVGDIGIITNIFVFHNHNLLFCTADHAYYSEDWGTVHESTVLDINGDPYVPVDYDNFSIYNRTSQRQFINGHEILCWGNYSTAGGVEYDNINIWYTADYGKTIKSCFKFGESVPDNLSLPIPARHVHNVDFNPADKTFWCQTGDEPTNEYSHWLKGTYDVTNDVWTWEHIGSGDYFKTSNIIFHGDYAYIALDNSPNGVMRCLYSDMGNAEARELIFTTPNHCLAVFVGERGDILASVSFYGGSAPARNLYYAPDGVNFKLVQGEIPAEYDQHNTGYCGYWRPNKFGKVLAAVYPDMPIEGWTRKPSVWLDDMVKRAGFPDALKPAR